MRRVFMIVLQNRSKKWIANGVESVQTIASVNDSLWEWRRARDIEKKMKQNTHTPRELVSALEFLQIFV